MNDLPTERQWCVHCQLIVKARLVTWAFHSSGISDWRCPRCWRTTKPLATIEEQKA